MHRTRTLAAVLCLAFPAGTALAEGFRTVTQRADFVQLVDGRMLTRLGIRLNVAPDGGISGKAFGAAVTGSWNWSDGFFCRDLSYGSRKLAQNCQRVQVSESTLRFIADKGAGESADLTLR